MQKLTFVTVLALALITCLAQPSEAAGIESVDDLMLASVGEFEVGNGQSETIAHHKDAHIYRICVRRARHAIPLKVTFDGKEETVAAGNCADFEAQKIKVAPAGKLVGDTILIGRYHFLK